MSKKEESLRPYSKLPTRVSIAHFRKYIQPYLSRATRGFKGKIPQWKTLNYILYVLHTGIQWNQLRPQRKEIHWSKDGSYEKLFKASVHLLAELGELDLSVLHADSSNAIVKKGGGEIGYSGHKNQKDIKEIGRPVVI
jgi:hypothetical protein